jgi:hypothetical protein
MKSTGRHIAGFFTAASMMVPLTVSAKPGGAFQTAAAITDVSEDFLRPSDDGDFHFDSPLDRVRQGSIEGGEALELNTIFASKLVGTIGLEEEPSAATVAPCYSGGRFIDQSLSVKYEVAAVFAAISIIGVANWDWGSSGFHFESEGWFGMDTASGGMDKLGHAYATYVITDALTYAIERKYPDAWGAQFTAALLACSLMTYVEVFDGLSSDHGFSYEDLVVDLLGAGFSMFRHSVPGMREKIDFRMQYLQSPRSNFEPLGDHSGQTYILALKASGFETLRETPLRYLELHLGYCTRGFSGEERRAGSDPERNLYVGVGLNLTQLLFGEDARSARGFSKFVGTGLEYVQVPYTYVATYGDGGR